MIAAHPQPPEPLGQLYGASRRRICALVRTADPAVPVPATPQWDVHDVVAHLAGIVEDAVSGNMDGVTTDAWTAAQVERGRGRSVGDLVDAWTQRAPLVEEVLSSGGSSNAVRAVLDVHTHEADLAHALGLAATIPADELSWMADVLRSEFDAEVAAAGLPAVRVDADDWSWFRGRMGRRTVEEVAAFAWSVDPTPYLEAWFVFGRAEWSLDEAPPGGE